MRSVFSSKKITLKSLFFLLSLYSFVWAQKPKHGTVLKLKGQASIQVPADEVKVMIELNADSEHYQKALDALMNKMMTLQTVLNEEKQNLGIQSIQNQQFFVDKNRIYTPTGVQEKGYLAKVVLEVSLVYNTEKLALLLAKIIQTQTDPSFSFVYGLSNENKIKDELLGQAVLDARQRAEVIAKALNLQIKQVLSVQYEVPQLYPALRNFAYESAPMQKDMSAGSMNRMAPMPMEDRLLSYLQLMDTQLLRQVEVWIDWELQ